MSNRRHFVLHGAASVGALAVLPAGPAAAADAPVAVPSADAAVLPAALADFPARAAFEAAVGERFACGGAEPALTLLAVQPVAVAAAQRPASAECYGTLWRAPAGTALARGGLFAMSHRHTGDFLLALEPAGVDARGALLRAEVVRGA